ncbi:MAG: UTP--glucose-1-phosphate uridylyltransferase [Phenylobacterium sp.]|uniref:UTP--glucose-1-phosphate uridylyltransferase n=1 Tax=Phenylobacterium sp. TaxID=1871053 RepID=UPI0025FE5C88|nr:UTP--glucose-1-phosphate uridylyltransferase [Phenylobacterium sp.]MCA6259062.1 UTP--glucose-1-phosphate uridylyltransferase [Phenylobacterium sp.]MCA6264571.1 UTP--glucose-1-phosphate uridylyltransferase [Phenylobacterium sp.]MCA6266880.1 UTP--glucose-1-phosphate uridylyltransferase [Phenylobacterium sp.]MCA6291689.1 UTP--glucose-1-phosphate uridylyltransferase [Phenylobacterium sp.]MCA6301837.1 UTP--glucose-1-phosphate uridylyltransferase [Phenylobacterium sp.]
MSGKVRKAVLPVAGLGTRVLPAAKVTPKEMLNVVDRPILSYIIEEGRAAGIEHFVFVTGRGKGAIEDYFDHHVELEAQLEAKGKLDILADVRRDLPKPGEMSFVRQMAPLGLGHAVWCARDIIGDEPFAVMLPDSPMMAEPAALAQAIAAFEQVGGNIVVVEPAPEGQAHKYGIVALDGQAGRLNRMTGMVEKPAPGTEPSNLFISGRYVLQPEIFERLARHRKGAGGEIQLTDAMADLMADQPFYALEYEGTTYDCGDKLGLLRANVAYALKRPDLAEGARAVLKDLLGEG